MTLLGKWSLKENMLNPDNNLSLNLQKSGLNTLYSGFIMKAQSVFPGLL